MSVQNRDTTTAGEHHSLSQGIQTADPVEQMMFEDSELMETLIRLKMFTPAYAADAASTARTNAMRGTE